MIKRKVQRLVEANEKVSNVEFKEFCLGMYLAGIGSDIGIEEFSSAENARLLQRLAKDKSQLDILGQALNGELSQQVEVKRYNSNNDKWSARKARWENFKKG